jgi:hypothetical protein
MEITLAELQILLDAAIGSLGILDRKDMAIFRFDINQRQATVNAILKRMDDVKFKVMSE